VTNSNIKKLSSIVMVLTLATCSAISGTFAKYTSSTSGSSTATAAKWSVKINGNDIAQSGNESMTFDLFKTVNELGTTTAETNVASGKIAPGTTGQVTINIQNKSEVNSNYTIDLAEKNEGSIPLQYSIDGTHWADDITDLKTSLSAVSLAQNKISTQIIYWRWNFDEGTHGTQTNASDSAIGAASTLPTVTVTTTITAVQVN